MHRGEPWFIACWLGAVLVAVMAAVQQLESQAHDLPASLLRRSASQLITQPWTGDFDGMMRRRSMMAQGYQESRLDQRAESGMGAIGIMHVMPSTARALNVGDIRQIESNVHAGVKYIRLIVDEYFDHEPMTDLTKTLFAFAAYNCGPARVRELRKEAARRNLNPNAWFDNVERIAGERIGRETVQYVSSIFKYYVAYTLTLDALGANPAAR